MWGGPGSACAEGPGAHLSGGDAVGGRDDGRRSGSDNVIFVFESLLGAACVYGHMFCACKCVRLWRWPRQRGRAQALQEKKRSRES